MTRILGICLLPSITICWAQCGRLSCPQPTDPHPERHSRLSNPDGHTENGILLVPSLNDTLEPRAIIAIASSLLFVSHPIQTQAVTYISQRFTSLAAFFYLLSLLLVHPFQDFIPRAEAIGVLHNRTRLRGCSDADKGVHLYPSDDRDLI